MNTEFFIAKRLTFEKESKSSFSRPIIKIALVGIALGLAVMLVAVAVVTGFKKEIRNKVIGFGSDIQIVNYDANFSYETVPISKNQNFYPGIDTIPGIKHIEVFATKPGIIKTKTDIEGVIVKGVGSDFDWSFFDKNMVAGKSFRVNDSTTSNDVVISKYLASLLRLKVGDEFAMFFIDLENRPRMRRFKVSGIYETSLEEFDKQFILADIKHIQKLNGWTNDQISGFEISIDDFSKIDYYTYEVREIAGMHFLNDGTKLKVISIRQRYPQIFDWLGLLDMNVWVLLILMLIVAGFNMVSGLLILILDRTNMIGVLKAVGSNNNFIRKIFLYQSGFLIIKGMLWGNVIGIGICLIQYYFEPLKLNQASYFINYVPINFNIFYFILINIGSMIITLLMLILPSLVIARISPAKSIRFE